jgi:hypothetical protein
MDLRKSLFGSIVLSGGSTLTKGFGDRLLHEVQRLAVKDMRIKIFAPPERKYTTWTGGSILAGLSTFKKVGVAFSYVNTMNANLFLDVGRQGRMARKPRHNTHEVCVISSTSTTCPKQRTNWNIDSKDELALSITAYAYLVNR